jgi:hypothetical protein
MALKDIYDNWEFRPILAGINKTPREATEGKVAVDFLPNTYQTQVANRTPGDKVVTQATEDDQTLGSFNTSTAFGYFSTLYNSPLKTFKSRLVHKYNNSDAGTYLDSTVVRNSPGALYSNLGNDAAQ